jgi:hypothetical protein
MPEQQAKEENKYTLVEGIYIREEVKPGIKF